MLGYMKHQGVVSLLKISMLVSQTNVLVAVNILQIDNKLTDIISNKSSLKQHFNLTYDTSATASPWKVQCCLAVCLLYLF